MGAITTIGDTRLYRFLASAYPFCFVALLVAIVALFAIARVDTITNLLGTFATAIRTAPVSGFPDQSNAPGTDNRAR